MKCVETLVSDGAFYSQEMVEKVLEKGIEVGFSALNGRRAPEDKLSAEQFVINQNTELIVACSDGFAPLSASRNLGKSSTMPSSTKKITQPVRIIRDAHSEDCPEFDQFGCHCVKGSAEAELVSELKEVLGPNYIDWPKNCLAAGQTHAQSTVLREAFEEILNCVRETVFRKERMADYWHFTRFGGVSPLKTARIFVAAAMPMLRLAS